MLMMRADADDHARNVKNGTNRAYPHFVSYKYYDSWGHGKWHSGNGMWLVRNEKWHLGNRKWLLRNGKWHLGT